MAGYRKRDREEEETVNLGDECLLVHETAKAILVDLDGEEHWIPKSVLRKGTTMGDVQKGQQGTLVIPRWFAEKEHLV